MSFHSDVVLQVRAELARLLGLPAEAVYVGDRAQKVPRQGLEVWIEPQDVEAPEAGLKLHPYQLHLRLKARRGADQTGEELVEKIKQSAEQVRRRFDGSRPYAQAVPRLLAVQAEEGSVVEAEDGLLECTLRLGFVEF